MPSVKFISGRRCGFTLIELIIVILLSGILAAVVAPLVANKFAAISQSAKRSYWVQQAEYALALMRQDLANSVPYSLCTNDASQCGVDDQVVEFLAAPATMSAQAARYRSRELNGFNRLQLANETSFDVFANIPDGLSDAGFISIGTTNVLSARTDWQTNMAGGSGTLAAISAVAASSNGSENSGPLTTITLNAAHNFTRQSPFNRAYFFSGPVAYQCDTSAGFLYRVSGYQSLAATSFESRVASSASSQRDRVIGNLQGCAFNRTAGNVFTEPTLQVTLQIGEGNESIQLIDTIKLGNAP